MSSTELPPAIPVRSGQEALTYAAQLMDNRTNVALVLQGPILDSDKLKARLREAGLSLLPTSGALWLIPTLPAPDFFTREEATRLRLILDELLRGGNLLTVQPRIKN